MKEIIVTPVKNFAGSTIFYYVLLMQKLDANEIMSSHEL